MTILLLNGKQSRKYKSIQEAYTYLSQNKDVYSKDEPFNNEVISFTGNYAQMIALVPTIDVNGKGITTDKDALKKEIAKEGAFICARTKAYAIKVGNNVLLNAVNHSATTIEDLKDSEILGFTTSLSETITPLLTDTKYKPYSINADMLSTLVDKGTIFNNSIGAASLVNADSGYASKALNTVFKLINENLLQFSLLITVFAESNPKFVENYFKAVAINNTGIHHTGIEGIIKNKSTGEGVEGVTISLPAKKEGGKAKTAVTDILGTYKLIKLMPGYKKFTISAPGFELQTIIFEIKRGKILELNISLQSAVISLSATA